MAYCWFNHINRFDHFMKIFKIWLPGKLPPPQHTHNKTTTLPLLTVLQPNPSERKRRSAPRPEGLPSGPRSTPRRDPADPGTLPPGVLSLHTVRKQNS